ncbi:hypothetical protein [Erwinia sorbitola]|uniref:Fimbria/pilus periplasmic chaperone n=1 Tax=Erwinia sorbitola TaxID=2681984 RepID=A0A6I6EI06_9GAMM|nr:hypothetical protein [Erwinia sorbitola]QGU89364.1 hypothetical protein GN242_20070 [Erwinia sorbitola]
MRRVAGWMLLAGGCLALFQAQAAGILRLTNTEIIVGGTLPPAKLEIENIGNSALYLDVTQELVQTPLTVPEVRLSVGEVPSPSLLISPVKLVLGPGQKRVLNVKVLRIPQQRKIWRVTFRPREKIVISASDEEERAVAPVSISIGYGVVIYQPGAV